MCDAPLVWDRSGGVVVFEIPNGAHILIILYCGIAIHLSRCVHAN